MEILPFLFYTITGVISGLSAGFFGIGGGIINVPALMGIFYLYGVTEEPVRSSVATSLFIIAFTSFSATYTHFTKNRTLRWKSILILGAGASIGAVSGVFISLSISPSLLKKLLGIFEFVVSVHFWRNFKAEKVGRTVSPLLAITGGFIAGVLSGMLGIGGGIFLVPFLTLTTSERHENVIAYSSAMITFSSLFGMSTFVVEGFRYNVSYVNLTAGISVAMVSIFFARTGVKALYRVETGLARKLYAIFLLLIGIRLII